MTPTEKVLAMDLKHLSKDEEAYLHRLRSMALRQNIETGLRKRGMSLFRITMLYLRKEIHENTID